jgi:hypothetical protein
MRKSGSLGWRSRFRHGGGARRRLSRRERRTNGRPDAGRSVLLRCAKKAVDHYANGGHDQGHANCRLPLECASNSRTAEDESKPRSDPHPRQAVTVTVADGELLKGLVFFLQAVAVGLFSFRELEKAFRRTGQNRFVLLQHLWMREKAGKCLYLKSLISGNGSSPDLLLWRVTGLRVLVAHPPAVPMPGRSPLGGSLGRAGPLQARRYDDPGAATSWNSRWAPGKGTSRLRSQTKSPHHWNARYLGLRSCDRPFRFPPPRESTRIPLSKEYRIQGHP